MDDGRPAPAPVSHVIVGTPTITRTIVVAFGILAVLCAVVGLILWSSGGSGLGFVVPRLLGTALLVPLAVILVSTLASGSASLPERLSGWSNPTIEFTPWPPQLGRTMTARYRRQPIGGRTRNRIVGDVEVQAELTCTEWVVYTVGTDTRTETHTAVKHRMAAPLNVTGDDVEANLTMVIPADAGGPTIHLDHNRIQWQLTARLGHPFGRRTSSSFPLDVAAELDVAGLTTEGGGTYRPGGGS